LKTVPEAHIFDDALLANFQNSIQSVQLKP
jgi:hypothetical protein